MRYQSLQWALELIAKDIRILLADSEDSDRNVL